MLNTADLNAIADALEYILADQSVEENMEQNLIQHLEDILAKINRMLADKVKAA